MHFDPTEVVGHKGGPGNDPEAVLGLSGNGHAFFLLMLMPEGLLQLFCQYRDDFKQVPDDAVIAFAQNGSIGVCIDRHNRTRCLHARKMLNRA